MEHFSHEQIDRILQEFHRVLKPEARLILLWPATSSVPQRMLRVAERIIHATSKHKDFRYGILVALDTLDLLSVYVDVIESRIGNDPGNYREFTQQVDSKDLSNAAPK